MGFERRKRKSVLKKLTTQPIYREKLLHTIWTCWTFIMLGWVESLFGPTFPDLRLIIGEDLETASSLVTITALGFLIGSGVTGLLYDKYDKLILVICAIIGTAITIAAVPWCTLFWLMMVIKCVSGMFAAGVDTGGNAEIVNIWGAEAAPYMQALHFCFSIGGIIAPFIAEPFLATQKRIAINESAVIFKNSSTADENTYELTHLLNLSFDSQESNTVSLKMKAEENITGNVVPVFVETKVQYSYLITGALMLITVTPFCVMYRLRPNEVAKTEAVAEKRDPTNFREVALPIRITILTLLSLLIIIYCGTDDIYAGFLMTFVLTELEWSKSEGSLATSLHWACFGVARLGCIFLVRYVKTSKLMIIFGVFVVLSFTGLLLSTLYEIKPLIWIFIGCPGIALSFIFPAMFTWTNENIVVVSGKISAMFLMSASTGVMLFPLLFGYTMERFSPKWFLYLLLGQSITWISLFLFTIFLTKFLLKWRHRELEIQVPESVPLGRRNS